MNEDEGNKGFIQCLNLLGIHVLIKHTKRMLVHIGELLEALLVSSYSCNL